MERQYALVHGNSVLIDRNEQPVITGFQKEKPKEFSEKYPSDSVWLPVEDKDSQEFDPFAGTHFRAAPRFEVSSDRVFRVYEIIPRRK